MNLFQLDFDLFFSSRITQKIHRSLSGGKGKDAGSEFPVLAGSHLPLKNPALEFVKAVCQVSSHLLCQFWFCNY